MSGYRPSYTTDEERKIIEYILEKNELHRMRGDKVWKNMEESGRFDRTWQSLKNHFRKKLIHKLNHPQLNIDKETQMKILKCYNNSEAAIEFQPPPPKTNEADNNKSKKNKTNSKDTRRVPDFLNDSFSSSSEED